MICIYEDAGWRQLLPLTYLRPVYDLRSGCRTLREKIVALYPQERVLTIWRWERDTLPDVSMLFLSGRAILEKPLPIRGREEIFVCGKEVVGFRTNPRRIRKIEKGETISSQKVLAWRLPQSRVLASIVRYPWNLIELNEPELIRELRHFQPRRTPDNITVVGNRKDLIISPSASIDPGTIVDLRRGRVWLDERAQVRAGSVIAGPCYIGKGTIIDGARVRPGCSFGPECRIGGEVEASIFFGYANKHHDGFIGHSIIGEWVNLGALTTNSDLRNDYDEVKVILNGRQHNTGLRKFGCIISDHAKTAIGTLLNTGTVIGLSANWFGAGLSPKTIPSFAWGAKQRWQLASALKTARIVMARRGVSMSPLYEQLMRRSYEK